MKVKEIKFINQVVIAGMTETFINSERAALRGTKVSVEGQFLRFDPKGKPATLIPLVNVAYITLSNDQTSGEEETPKTSQPVNGQKAKKQNS